MKLPRIADFIREKVRIGRGRQAPAQALKMEAQRRADNAKALLNNDVFIEAYQDELADIVDQFLRTDVTVPEERDRLVPLAARSQELQALAKKLAGYVNAIAADQARERTRAA